ncbi:hypothetical protein QIF44_13320 [Stenotrophomonas indicatrix]|uniref:hypothetical protein n=1 Tax=Stenotrophomonas indicatrix TaxID=2045451 RepID=UPI00249C7862|nr:hypothetical protein [Stenotrophomonas indicatrix]WGV53289.1 hypothetical protein QIF44_13320 [Stenotrophomonas indicatrix]
MLRQKLDSLVSQCEQFNANVSDLATFYLAADAGAKLISNTRIPEGYSLEMRMSSDFPLVATTVRKQDDVLALCGRGDYERLNAYQAVVALCSLFEVFIVGVGETLHVQPSRCISITSWRRGNAPIDIRSPTLCMLRSIHEAFDIDSPLNGDTAICWIYHFIQLRNIVVHDGGRLEEAKRSRLVSSWSARPTGQHLVINGDHIDDMVHFLLSHVRSFLFQARKRCLESPA